MKDITTLKIYSIVKDRIEMSDFNAENDRLLYEIEQYLINNRASDYLHYFLQFNYDMLMEKGVTRILAPVDAALQRLVDRTGKSLEQISNLPEGIDVFNNFLSSTPFHDKYPVYTAINGTIYGKTAEDLKRLKPSGSNKFGEIEIWIIDGIISRNKHQISMLIQANPPQTPVRKTGIIGADTTTNFDDLPNPILRQIVLNLSDLIDILNNCRTSIQLNLSICNSEDFWNEKLRKDHPEQRSMIGSSWKETYKMLSGRLYTFGSGSHGQLGLGNVQDQSKPELVEGLKNVSSVACGTNHTAAISNKELYTWGNGASGQLGHGDSQIRVVPRIVEKLVNVIGIACGVHHTAVISNGRLYTFGAGQFGKLGHGDQQNQLRPTRVEGLDNVTSVACGSHHTAAISNGLLYTFGAGEAGQLGHGDRRDEFRPKLVEGLDNVTNVACGTAHTALISGGQLYTFGSGESGQLGHGDRQNQLRPVLIEGLDNVTFVSCGYSFTAAISNGLLYTFGAGDAGQLGHGTDHLGRVSSESRPKLVEGLKDVTVVAGGNGHTAVVANGRLYTFGLGMKGQLGQGENPIVRHLYAPKLVHHLHNVIYVAAGANYTAAIGSPK